MGMGTLRNVKIIALVCVALIYVQRTLQHAYIFKGHIMYLKGIAAYTIKKYPTTVTTKYHEEQNKTKNYQKVAVVEHHTVTSC